MKHIIAGVISLGFAISASAQDLTPEQGRQYMAAAGEVLAAKKTMEGVASVCGEDAAQLSAVWNERNKMAIAKAENLRNIVLRDIEKLKDVQTAKAFEEKQNALLADKVAEFVREIEDLPPEKKKHICERYVETVNQGKWDVRENAGLYNFLMNAQ